LSYSEKDDDAYCMHCVLFAGKSVEVDNLVKQPFENWKDAIEIFNNYTNSEYYKTCILKGICAIQFL